MIDRRSFVRWAVGGALATSFPARAQQAKVWQIGFLSAGSAPAPGVSDPADAFWQRLRELGYAEGATLVVERRFAEGKGARLPELAAELARLKPDVIVTRGSPSNMAAKNATATIPIVMASGLDPVREGVVASLARPGGNVTGMMFASDARIIAKRLQLLKEALPRMSRLAVAARSDKGADAIWLKDTEDSAKVMDISLHVLIVEDAPAWSDAFAAMVATRADAVYLIESPNYIAHAKMIADLALRNRMPSMFGADEHVRAGGLMSYGLDLPAVFRRAAELVDKVLKGAKPADIPIEQPTKYELVVNLRTAKALGIAIPNSLLARADEVIQ
jgi:putative ABC transport system substrate-binding protein